MKEKHTTGKDREREAAATLHAPPSHPSPPLLAARWKRHQGARVSGVHKSRCVAKNSALLKWSARDERGLRACRRRCLCSWHHNSLGLGQSLFVQSTPPRGAQGSIGQTKVTHGWRGLEGLEELEWPEAVFCLTLRGCKAIWHRHLGIGVGVGVGVGIGIGIGDEWMVMVMRLLAYSVGQQWSLVHHGTYLGCLDRKKSAAQVAEGRTPMGSTWLSRKKRREMTTTTTTATTRNLARAMSDFASMRQECAMPMSPSLPGRTWAPLSLTRGMRCASVRCSWRLLRTEGLARSWQTELRCAAVRCASLGKSKCFGKGRIRSGRTAMNGDGRRR